MTLDADPADVTPHSARTDTPPALPSVFDLAFLTDVEGITELILVRHGEQDLPNRGSARVGDLVDPPLSARGERQAELVGHRFRDLEIDVVYSSGLRRAHQTGVAVATHHGLTPVVIPELEEIRLYEGLDPAKTPMELLGPTLLLGARDRMLRERKWDTYPFSERSADFRGRVTMAIDGIVVSHPGQRVVVACHGGVINAYLAHHLGIEADMWFRPAHTAVNLVWAKDQVRSLRSINDVSHLALESGLVSH
jgi:probable phosphoglycerate mutase